MCARRMPDATSLCQSLRVNSCADLMDVPLSSDWTMGDPRRTVQPSLQTTALPPYSFATIRILLLRSGVPKKVVIEATFYEEGTRAFQFNVAGLNWDDGQAPAKKQ